jgi:hypothetical protein
MAVRPIRILVLLATVAATLSVVVAAAPPASAGEVESPEQHPEIVIDIYWGDGCPFCHDAIEHLVGFADEEDGVEGADLRGVVRARQPRAYEAGGRRARCPGRRGAAHRRGNPGLVRVQRMRSAARSRLRCSSCATIVRSPDEVPAPDGPSSAVIDLPLVGDLDLTGRSTLLATVLIALVDGFNPCSLWVLTVLLALVLHSGSRARVLAIGGTFLVVTTLVYGLFVIGVYSTLGLVSAMDGIRLVVAAFAFTFGLINIKDFLWFKRGVSLTIPDEQKPGIYRRVRALVRPGIGLPAALAGTIVMAGGIALIELPCTAGFPVIWSDLMRAADVGGAEFGSLLGVYLSIYLLDELVVFGAAVLTMRATKLQERHGRMLKLVGGMVMVSIAVAIVFLPAAMESVGGVLAVFGVALAASGMLAAVERRIRAAGPAG